MTVSKYYLNFFQFALRSWFCDLSTLQPTFFNLLKTVEAFDFSIQFLLRCTLRVMFYSTLECLQRISSATRKVRSCGNHTAWRRFSGTKVQVCCQAWVDQVAWKIGLCTCLVSVDAICIHVHIFCPRPVTSTCSHVSNSCESSTCANISKWSRLALSPFCHYVYSATCSWRPLHYQRSAVWAYYFLRIETSQLERATLSVLVILLFGWVWCVWALLVAQGMCVAVQCW